MKREKTCYVRSCLQIACSTWGQYAESDAYIWSLFYLQLLKKSKITLTLGKFTFCVKVTITFDRSKKVDMFPNFATECKIIDRLQAFTLL